MFKQRGNVGLRQTYSHADRKILPLELKVHSWSKSPPTTFFVLTDSGRFDFGMSLFQTLAGCSTKAELYNTSHNGQCQACIEATLSTQNTYT